MPHVVIVGAGMGGMQACFEIRKELGDSVDITVVSNGNQFYFVPASPWLALGLRKKEDLSLNIEPLLHSKRILFVNSALDKVDPSVNKIFCSDGTEIEYDYLVLATGYKFGFDEIEGFEIDGKDWVGTIANFSNAEKLAEEAKSFFTNLEYGNVVVGIAPYSACFGSAYEFTLLLDNELRNKKIRENFDITFVTAEPFIGHFGVGGIGDISSMLKKRFENLNINWITNAKIEKISKNKVYVTEFDNKGNFKNKHILRAGYKMIMPPCRGIDVLHKVEGLTDARGFVIVDEYQRSPKYKNIFALGVCVSRDPCEKTSVPICCPKTDYMIEGMVKIVAQNIKALIAKRDACCTGVLSTIWLADFGEDGMIFIAMPQMPPRDISWAAEGKWVHFAKIAFEKYFMRNLKRGVNEPIFEKYILKMASVESLVEEDSGRDEVVSL